MRYSFGLCGFPGALAGFAAALMMAMMSAAVAAEDGAAAKPDGAAKSVPAATAQGAAKDEPALLGAQLRLGKNLVNQLASGRKSEQPNVVVSPASLAMVFSMLDMGADEQMRAAIRKTLGFRVAKGANKGDLEGLRALASSVLKRAQEGGPLALANMIVFDPASKPYPQPLEELKAAGAEVSVEDLSKPETISRINDWVKAQTRGLIPAVIEETPQEAGLVAVNALHFKDRWKTPFDQAATRNEKFQVSQGGQSIDVPMMHSEGRLAFRQDSKFVAAALSYVSGEYELVVLCSKDAALGVNEFSGVASWLGGGQGFEVSDGEIALPRFSASGSEDLLPVIDALGLAKARKAAGALKGFTATSQTIARVVQKTELRVNEEGTEAAAATAATTLRSATPRQFVKMIVDKPFMFALRDKRSGLVLLQGYISNPSEAKQAAR